MIMGGGIKRKPSNKFLSASLFDQRVESKQAKDIAKRRVYKETRKKATFETKFKIWLKFACCHEKHNLLPLGPCGLQLGLGGPHHGRECFRPLRDRSGSEKDPEGLFLRR